MRQVKLAGSVAGSLASRLCDEPAVFVVLHHAVIAVAVGDEDVALRVPSHIRGAAKDVFLRRRVWPVGRRDSAVDGRRPAAEHHKKLALRTELRHGVRALIDGPDIVLRIDADRVREFKSVIALADFLDEDSILIEFPQPCVGAPVIDEDMAFGIRRHSNGFAESFAGGNLQEVRHRRVGDFGYILRRRLLLCERMSATQHQDNSGYTGEKTLHRSLPGNSDETFSFSSGTEVAASIANRISRLPGSSLCQIKASHVGTLGKSRRRPQRTPAFFRVKRNYIDPGRRQL